MEKEKSKITRAKLKQAFQLAQEGQYKRARFILEPIADHPKAKTMLKMMEGKRDLPKKRKPFFTTFRVILIGFFGLLVLGGVLGWQAFQAEMQDVDLMEAMGFNEPEIDEDIFLRANARQYCSNYTSDAEECRIWSNAIVSKHSNAGGACFAPYQNILIWTPEHYTSMRSCLRQAGIPNPN